MNEEFSLRIQDIPQEGSVAMTMDGSKIQVNGQGTPKGASAVIDESVSQAPIIDDSLIADDHEGLPLISAVFSLARNGKTEEASISGTNLGVSSPISPKTSTQSGSLNTSSPINAGPLPSNKAFSSDNEIQRQGASASVGVGSNSVQSFVSLTKNDTTNTTGSATLSSCALQREPGLTAAEAGSNSKSSGGGAVTHVQTAGNMVRLVKLVNSVSKVDQLRANSPLTTSAALIKKSPPSIVLPSGSPSSPAKPGLQLPRQIAMKQPAQGTRQTSIILNLKPGEPIPKAINLLSPDGKSVMLLTLSEGGKQLVTPSGAPATDGKILIPIPPNVTVSSPMTSKPTTLLNKVYPIAPNPVKTTPLPSQGISSSSVITSVASPPKQPVVHSRAVYSSGSSLIGSFSNASESRVSMVTPAAASTNLASPSVQSAVSTNLETADPTPSSFDEDKSTGLSPQEAKIQRLKQLIQQQEDAVNKLREKRRLELEQIRNPSSPSKVDDGAATDDSLRTERPALAEQKRPASPFAVPLPPKKRVKDYDSSVKTVLPKATDSSLPPSDGAFVPNADDRAFVQLVGLENVISNIK